MFAVAVFAVMLSVYVLATVIFGLAASAENNGGQHVSISWWNPEIALIVFPIVGLTIVLASAFRVRSLRMGGAAIAASVGGREVVFHTRDADERRLLNVVEEIAIASGVPVPRVFILENEAGINAFAAGYSIDDAAVAVTRGCLMNLSRDELQGVVAHEFSHIFNGDMRLNIRLIGFIAGLIVIGTTGQIVLRSMSRGALVPRRRSDNNNGGAVIAIMAFGLGLMLIGFVGTIAGQMIQAAISRQREYLADASAVQFTRNPNGLRGALAKIGGLSEHGEISGSNVADMRHMFFASTASSMFGGLATHPPIEDRIRRLGGNVSDAAAAPSKRAQSSAVAPLASGFAGAPIAGLGGQTVAERAGNPQESDFARARVVVENLPQTVRDAAHDPTLAPAVVHAVLLTSSNTQTSAQLRALTRNVSPAHAAAVESLTASLQSLPDHARLPLLELCAPALRSYPEQIRNKILDDSRSLAQMDGLSLAELLLITCIERWVRAEAGPTGRIISHTNRKRASDDIALVVQATVAATARDSEQAAEMLAHAAEHTSPGVRAQLGVLQPSAPADVIAALGRLATMPGALRHELLNAVAAGALSDQVVTRDEADICGAIAVLIGAPLPVLTPGSAPGR